MFQTVLDDIGPAEHAQYTGASFDPGMGDPYVNPDDRADYLDQTPGTTDYHSRPGVPNYLDLQSDGVGAVEGVSGDDNGASGMPALAANPEMGYFPIAQFAGGWYDSNRPNAGYPLPVVGDVESASVFDPSLDQQAMYANYDFGIDDYDRFNQPQLVSDGHRLTERTLDIPTPWKANPTFPAQIQKVRPWDKVMGAWPWKGTKTAVGQGISTPNYYPDPLPDGVVSPGGAARATIPNTPSLWPQPMTWRVMPEQWDNNYVSSGL